MATQNVPVTALQRISSTNEHINIWFVGPTNPALDAAFAPSGRYLQLVGLIRSGTPGNYTYEATLHVDDFPNIALPLAGDDFTSGFEDNGSVTVSVGGTSYTFEGFTATDPDEPYTFTENVEAWWNALNALGISNYAVTDDDVAVLDDRALPPGVPSGPSPANGATNVALDANLDWADTVGANEYGVYASAAPPPDSLEYDDFPASNIVSVSNFSFTGDLNPGLLTYWVIIAFNDDGATRGPTWTFTTTGGLNPPAQATNPSPADGATNVGLRPVLNWADATGADSYRVFLGPNQSNLPLLSTGLLTASQYALLEDLEFDTPYYWRIDTVNDDGTTPGQVWDFRTRQAVLPGVPSGPSPANGATNVALDANLDWADTVGANEYGVYASAAPPPDSLEYDDFPASNIVSVSNFSFTGDLNPGLLTYWVIIAFNDDGATRGPTWTFTTTGGLNPPAQATNPSPADGATNVGLRPVLNWADATGADSYRVFLGPNQSNLPLLSTGLLTASQYALLEDLEFDTPYYWRIDTVNDDGTTPGQVWDFRTESAPPPPPQPPPQATNPSPTDGATDVDADTNLGWSNVVEATLYRVYLGTDQNNLPFIASPTTNNHDPVSDLQPNTLYYWRVDPVNIAANTVGEVWSFTTGALPVMAPDIANMTNTVGDVIDITLPVGTGGTGALSYSISGLPQGLQFDETTRRITGTITG